MKNSKKKALVNKGAKKTTRRLFAIDIENFCGKPVLSEADIAEAREKIEKAFHPSNEDMVLIGTTHTNNFTASSFAWRGARQVWMPNHDGADLAIIKALKDYRIDTFAKVFLMSGDGIFAETVKTLSDKVAVTVVANHGRINQKLAAAAPKLAVA